eukprot:SAG11_NODE_2572_length_3210_cov_18.286725_5_plen_97_part_00
MGGRQRGQRAATLGGGINGVLKEPPLSYGFPLLRPEHASAKSIPGPTQRTVDVCTGGILSEASVERELVVLEEHVLQVGPGIDLAEACSGRSRENP